MRVLIADKTCHFSCHPAGTSKAGRRPVRVSRISAYHRRKHSRGFTLVELLITVVIVLTICAIAVPNLMAGSRAKWKRR